MVGGGDVVGAIGAGVIIGAGAIMGAGDVAGVGATAGLGEVEGVVVGAGGPAGALGAVGDAGVGCLSITTTDHVPQLSVTCPCTCPAVLSPENR